VKDDIGPVPGKCRLQRRQVQQVSISQVDAIENMPDIIDGRAPARQSGDLDIGDVVQQVIGQMATDKTGDTCDEDSRVGTPSC